MECSVKDFILTAQLEDLEICDKLIEYHRISNDKYEGKFFSGDKIIVNKNIKNSTDVSLKYVCIRNIYVDVLKNICEKYISLFNFCDYYFPWGIVEPITIQHYAPNQGYYQWHTERMSNIKPSCDRHLVFMTYLNDVTDGGETEFYYQKLKVQPKKGLTLIWPADWTHTHRGIPSPTQEKYIVTGWFNYYQKEINHEQ
jgi:prolyl 4-hydroxylase